MNIGGPPRAVKMDRRWSLLVACLLAGAPRDLHPQKNSLSVDFQNLTVGSRDEQDLLRWLLTTSLSIQRTKRNLTVAERDSLMVAAAATSASPVPLIAISQPWLSSSVNTLRSYSENDGVVWAGRGLTLAGSAGINGARGAFSYSARPIAFWTQNARYAVPQPAPTGSDRFGSPYWGEYIDVPFRFGDRSYARLDPGESWARVDSRWLAAGVSTATSWWGPAHVYPLVLGSNAGGFPHVFIETGLPRNVGIGRISSLWLFGKLQSSGFAPPATGDSARAISGALVSFSPHGVPGLEVGGSRLFHLRWGRVPIDFQTLSLPFSHLYKKGLGSVVDSAGPREYNQVASAFFRLAPPARGVEMYGEYYREDHSFDERDFLAEPDHESGFMLGVRRVWLPEGSSVISTLTIEVVNGRLTHLRRIRTEAPMYIHTTIPEGHTLRGQVLGSPALFGGNGATIAFDRRRGHERWSASVAVENTAQNIEGGTWNGVETGVFDLAVSRTSIAGRVERTLGFRLQPGFGFERGVNVVVEMKFQAHPGSLRF